MKLILCVFLMSIGIVHAQGLEADLSQEIKKECKESGDFIKNTALGRKNGMTKKFALDKLEEDFQTIRSFPNSFRWFAHSKSDENFLRNAVNEVFKDRMTPEKLREATEKACIDYKLSEFPG